MTNDEIRLRLRNVVNNFRDSMEIFASQANELADIFEDDLKEPKKKKEPEMTRHDLIRKQAEEMREF